MTMVRHRLRILLSLLQRLIGSFQVPSTLYSFLSKPHDSDRRNSSTSCHPCFSDLANLTLPPLHVRRKEDELPQAERNSLT